MTHRSDHKLAPQSKLPTITPEVRDHFLAYKNLKKQSHILDLQARHHLYLAYIAVGDMDTVLEIAQGRFEINKVSCRGYIECGGGFDILLKYVKRHNIMHRHNLAAFCVSALQDIYRAAPSVKLVKRWLTLALEHAAARSAKPQIVQLYRDQEFGAVTKDEEDLNITQYEQWRDSHIDPEADAAKRAELGLFQTIHSICGRGHYHKPAIAR